MKAHKESIKHKWNNGIAIRQQHGALYTSKHIIITYHRRYHRYLYIYIYIIYIFNLEVSVEWLWSNSTRLLACWRSRNSQSWIIYAYIYTNNTFLTLCHNKKHSHKNITFEIIISTSVSDKILATQNVQSCIVLDWAWKKSVNVWKPVESSDFRDDNTETNEWSDTAWARERFEPVHRRVYGSPEVLGGILTSSGTLLSHKSNKARTHGSLELWI